jgi:transposase
MVKALSLDLRERVLAAVDSGLSCRQAAERFGVSAASAIRWVQRRRKQGTAEARPQGGDRRSARIEAHGDDILAIISETPDITLAELQDELAEGGTHFGIGTLWRFLERRRITLKKSRRTPPSRSVPTS